MNDLHAEHMSITAKVKQIIEPLKIVFPAQYAEFYAEEASIRNIELKPDEMLTREMLDEKMVRHVITLAECTDQAISAIEAEDKTMLKGVLLRTRQLQEEIQELQKIIYEDGLTKSFNRKWMDDMILDNENLRLRDRGTIVLIDLNKFKAINDTYGHIAGDKVLIHVAMKLKETGGRVVRYGGDEFLVIFDSSIMPSEVQQRIEKVLHYFDRIQFKTESYSFKAGFSYGMAPFDSGSKIEKVIEIADKAMYTQKYLQNASAHAARAVAKQG